MSLLTIIQQATAEMGLAVPTIVVGNSDADTIQQLALLNACGYELYRQYPWEALNKEYRFTVQYITTTGTTVANSTVITAIANTTGVDSTYMVVGTGINTDTYVATLDSPTQVTMSQAATASGTVSLNFCKTMYSMPSDYAQITDRTMWDKSKHWEMLGPETAQQWQWLKSGYISTGPRIRLRIMGGYFQIWPAVTTSEYLGFEYLSNAWAESSIGTPQTSFLADTDLTIFPDRLLVLGLKKKYFEIKGFDATAFTRDYQGELSICKANDSGSKTLSMNPKLSSVLITWDNIPDSGYGT